MNFVQTFEQKTLLSNAQNPAINQAKYSKAMVSMDKGFIWSSFKRISKIQVNPQISSLCLLKSSAIKVLIELFNFKAAIKILTINGALKGQAGDLKRIGMLSSDISSRSLVSNTMLAGAEALFFLIINVLTLPLDPPSAQKGQAILPF